MRKKFLSHCNNCFQSTHFNDEFKSCIIYNMWQVSAFLLVIFSFLIVLVGVHGISPEFLPCTYHLSREKNMCVEWSCLNVSNFPFQFLGL